MAGCLAKVETLKGAWELRQTLPPRAPEVVYKATALTGANMDIWSLGQVIVALCGLPITACSTAVIGPEPTNDQAIQFLQPRWQEYLGDPRHLLLPRQQPVLPSLRRPRQTWPSQVSGAIGSVGVDLLDKMLTYDPQQRISSTDASRHPYLTPYVMPLMGLAGAGPHTGCVLEPIVNGSSGQCIFEGRRNQWSIRVGA